jgi:hypothetical protein
MTTATVRPYRIASIATGHILTTLAFGTYAEAVAAVENLNRLAKRRAFAITREQP